MAKENPSSRFVQDKKDTVENLKAIQTVLTECINEEMMDNEDHFYIEVLDLIDEIHLIKTYPELAEIISKAKTLESDIDAWLSMKRRETLAIRWPSMPS